MADCIILRRGGGKKYIYNRYNINEETTYTWRRYEYTYEYEISIDTSRSITYDIVAGDTVYRSASCDSRGNVNLYSGFTPDDCRECVGYYVYDGSTVLLLQSRNSTVWYSNRARYFCAEVEAEEVESTSYIGTVSSTNGSEYPNGGTQGGYYYDSRTSSTEQSRGDYVDQIIVDESGSYPSDGISGQYWYVYQGETRGAGALRRILAG